MVDILSLISAKSCNSTLEKILFSSTWILFRLELISGITSQVTSDYAEIRKVDILKYSLTDAIVLNQKEVEVALAEDDKLVKSLANVIRRLTTG